MERKIQNSGGLFFVISAPSGAGKTSLCRHVLDRDPELMFSVSHTTRAPRKGEQDGVDYHFVDTATFDRMIRENRFMEWADVYGRKYGTSKDEIARAKSLGKDLLIEIDCQGAEQLRKVMPEAIGIFIVPPSVETLRERLKKRNTDSEGEIEKRIGIALRELMDYRNFTYAVVNDDFDRAAGELEAIVKAERSRTTRRIAFVETLLKTGGNPVPPA